nr:4-phosphoerythronate dehydrogenase PdxB [uncultured Carboxylicivirga sp.]
MKIIADDKIPFLQGVFENVCEVAYLPGAQITKDILKGADALITRTRTKCNKDSLLDSSVRMIASATIGFDHIDTSWCEQNGINWTNAPGCNAESVKQYVASVFGMLVIDKGWRLKGKKLAVVGVGNVGSRIVKLAEAIGMKVYQVDPPRARKEMDQTFFNLQDIVADMDIITFHTPLNREGEDRTYHLCDEGLLSKMKKTALVINSSRGEVIDGNALKDALQNEQIAEAVLDVWEKEPDIDKELMNKVWLATPHIAGYSLDGKANGTMMSVQAISKFFKLNLDNWEPENIPVPKNADFEIDCEYLSDEQVLAEACVHTYSVKEDNIRLRMKVDEFEKQRGNYPLRREFKAFNVILKKGSEEQVQLLKSVGFVSVCIK